MGGEIVRRLSCGQVNAISALAFAPNSSAVTQSEILAVACQDDAHTVVIFNWKTSQILGSVSGIGTSGRHISKSNKILTLTFSLDLGRELVDLQSSQDVDTDLILGRKSNDKTSSHRADISKRAWTPRGAAPSSTTSVPQAANKNEDGYNKIVRTNRIVEVPR